MAAAGAFDPQRVPPPRDRLMHFRGVTRITWSGPKRELDSSHSHAATSEVSR
jgi:hypothetical protein